MIVQLFFITCYFYVDNILIFESVMELVGSRYRPQTNTAVIGFISSGAVIMAAMASAIRDDFRYQLAVFAPMIFFMVYAI